MMSPRDVGRAASAGRSEGGRSTRGFCRYNPNFNALLAGMYLAALRSETRSAGERMLLRRGHPEIQGGSVGVIGS
jgi:hypothetical protein